MSYILSALKRAERHRKREDPPSVLSVQVANTPPKPSWKGLQISAVVLSGMALAAVGAWYLANWVLDGNPQRTLPRQPSIADVPTKPQPESAAVVAPARTGQASEITAGMPRTSDLSPSTLPQGAAQGAAKTVDEMQFPAHERAHDEFNDPYLRPNKQTREILDFHRLSPELRSQMPSFTVSGYLYSAARPSANKVIINDIALREGQYVNDDLRVKEINADHIVMDYRGLLFRISRDQLSQY